MIDSQFESLIEELDSEHMIDQIESFGGDCEAAWRKFSDVSFSDEYSSCSNIVLTGMGGSGAANEMIKEIAFSADVSIEVIHDYTLPGYVDERSLVIASSYSGNTEETIASVKSALELGSKIIIITTGGKLAAIAKEHNLPCLMFSFHSQPRMSFSYLLIALLATFSRLGLYETKQDLAQVFLDLSQKTIAFHRETTKDRNPAKRLAEKMYQKFPIVYSSPLLKSCGLRFKTMLNEDSDSFAAFDYYPELDHNSVAGYTKPQIPVIVVQLESMYDTERIKTRQRVTLEIMKQNNIETERVFIEDANDSLTERLIMTNLLDAASYYLALLYGVDPSNTPNIAYIKSELT
ncbi:MAG: bifunctional phosphoglucose/phosphomannose isomerase [Patescibacteria group bacterium]|jgi:glucose/mannose-6-phosphate isomerase